MDKNINITNNQDIKIHNTSVSFSFRRLSALFGVVILVVSFVNLGFSLFAVNGFSSTLLQANDVVGFDGEIYTFYTFDVKNYLYNITGSFDIFSNQINDIFAVPMGNGDILQLLKTIVNLLIASINIPIMLPINLMSFVVDTLTHVLGINIDFLAGVTGFNIPYLTM